MQAIFFISRRTLAGLALALAVAFCAWAGTARAQAPLPGLGPIGVKGGSRANQAEPAPRVRVSARTLQSAVSPGGAFAVAIILDHAEHWHTWPAAEQDVLPKEIAEFAIRTSIDAPESLPAWLGALGKIQWPTPMPGAVADINHPGKAMDVPLYQGRAVVYIPIFVSQSAPLGPAGVTFTVGYQACNESTCEPPESVEVTAEVMIVADAGSVEAGIPDSEQAALIAGFDSAALATPAAMPPASGSKPEVATTTHPDVDSADGNGGSGSGGGGGGGGGGVFWQLKIRAPPPQRIVF